MRQRTLYPIESLPWLLSGWKGGTIRKCLGCRPGGDWWRWLHREQGAPITISLISSLRHTRYKPTNHRRSNTVSGCGDDIDGGTHCLVLSLQLAVHCRQLLLVHQNLAVGYTDMQHSNYVDQCLMESVTHYSLVPTPTFLPRKWAW